MIQVTEYNPKWVSAFEKESATIRRALAPVACTCHHMGSTAVPEMAAKPVIDILVEVPLIDQVKEAVPALEDLGYENREESGIPRRHFFCRQGKEEGDFPCNLHIFEKDSIQVRRHLRFRDYLRQHSAEAHTYQEIKRELAEAFPENIVAYQQGKTGIVQEIDRKAMAWQAEGGVSPSCFNKAGDRPTREELVRSLHHNLHMHMIYFAWYTEGMTNIPQPGDLTAVSSAVGDDTYNYILDARFKEETAIPRIREAIMYYLNRDLPFSWWLGPLDQPSDLGELLVGRGLQPNEEDVGMVLALENTEKEFAASPEIKRVLHRDQFQELCHIHETIGIERAPEAYEKIYRGIPENAYGEGANIELYILYKEGKPVCSGIVLFHAGVAGIYFIATVPEARRQGHATKMMEHLLNRVQEEGYLYATLTASEAGVPVYTAIGFEPICSYQEYGMPAEEE